MYIRMIFKGSLHAKSISIIRPHFFFILLLVIFFLLQAEDESFDGDYEEPEVVVDMSVVKNKSFPMPPIGVEEAVMCLDYIGHDCELTFDVCSFVQLTHIIHTHTLSLWP